jgi:hypothetical protein
MILGLDISTSVTGYTLIDDAGNIVENSYIDFKKETGIFEKAAKVEKILGDLHRKYDFDKVWIESSLMMFSAGKSSAVTIDTLAKFNGIVSWIAYGFCTELHFIPAVSARKQIGLKMVKGRKGKDIVMEHMLNSESWFKVDYTKTGKIKPYCYDMADSFVVAKAGFLQWQSTQSLTC